MKLLLDTHVWVWSASTSSRLSPRARRTIEATANEIWISPISTWELILLSDRGRLSLDPDPISWLRAALAGQGFEPETRPFRPHVTLARKVTQPVPTAPFEPLGWPVAEFALVESITDRSGSIYTPLASWPLHA